MVIITPSLSAYRRILGDNGSTIGQVRKKTSDKIMQFTWNGDIQSKTCYIYDYFHDDNKDIARDIIHLSNTTKTKIDVKFIITQYSTLSKDQVEYHIEFKPNQPLRFNKDDSLYYYETDYRDKYYSEFPVGMYIDIPDDNGVYFKWLICAKEIANQFPKYIVLPCDYYFHWIENDGQSRYKRKMWGVSRTQNSYNSGLWLDYLVQTTENQTKAKLPLNAVTEKIYYTNGTEQHGNQRMIISANIPKPIVWQLSKVENGKPFGIQNLTFTQDAWNEHSDYKDLDEIANGDVFAMYADYYLSPIEPSTPDTTVEEPITGVTGTIKYSNNIIKVGGSYKLLEMQLVDDLSNDITDQYIDVMSINNWHCYINDEEITNRNDLIVWLEQTDNNKIKVKFAGDRSYLTDILVVKFIITVDENEIEAEAQFEIIAL